MGIYLNPGAGMLRRARNSQIYVDKSEMLRFLNARVDTEQCFLCVSRPRRFGKSMAANMISAYYDRTVDQRQAFAGLKIASDASFARYAGQFDVLKLNMQEFLSETEDMTALLADLRASLAEDLQAAYPEVSQPQPQNLRKVMERVYAQTGRGFVIIIDEWDCIFREKKNHAEEQKQYLDFLRDWLKDKEYVALAYMTGILPIKKYGTHSALNMFEEFSMEDPDALAEFVGFTEAETEALCKAYDMDMEECRAWYDGYSFAGCPHVYSPKSVVDAMRRHSFGGYWNSTETYEALKIYIDLNEGGLRDAIVTMMAGGRTKIDTSTFQNDMTTFAKMDDVLTLLVHLGYLGYDKERQEVFIPNNEIMGTYVSATSIGEEWAPLARAIKASDALLAAIFAGDEGAVARGIEQAHFETSQLQYHDENALSYTLSLALYSARRYYNTIRELPTGRGFADLAFLPRPQHAEKPALLVELKWDRDAETALRQIHEKKYAGALAGFAGKVLLVGVSYDRKTKEHECRIENWEP